MKKFAIAAILAILLPLGTYAQTITTAALSRTTFCEGTAVSVSYTASGTFGAKNIFTVQLSAPDGSFSPSFQNIGQVKSTTSGTITATLPSTPGEHYRLRVTASNPYTVGNDNGSDITVDAPPGWMGFDVSKRVALVGDTVIFYAEGYPAGSSFTWNCGLDATPQTASNAWDSVVFTNPGIKHIHLTASVNSPCLSGPVDTSDIVVIFDCTPSIASDVFIDSVPSDESSFPGSNGIWVVPGGTLNLGANSDGPWRSQSRPIFAEAGTTVGGGGGHVIYLKPGAVYTGGNNIVVYSPGASVPSGMGLECGSLSFDYSNAPPYKIDWEGVSADAPEALGIRIYPNPAANLVTIQAPQIPSSFVVRNDLGAIVLMDNGPIATSKIEFDVSHFAAGVYYVELGIGGRTSTSKFTISR